MLYGMGEDAFEYGGPSQNSESGVNEHDLLTLVDWDDQKNDWQLNGLGASVASKVGHRIAHSAMNRARQGQFKSVDEAVAWIRTHAEEIKTKRIAKIDFAIAAAVNEAIRIVSPKLAHVIKMKEWRASKPGRMADYLSSDEEDGLLGKFKFGHKGKKGFQFMSKKKKGKGKKKGLFGFLGDLFGLSGDDDSSMDGDDGDDGMGDDDDDGLLGKFKKFGKKKHKRPGQMPSMPSGSHRPSMPGRDSVPSFPVMPGMPGMPGGDSVHSMPIMPGGANTEEVTANVQEATAEVVQVAAKRRKKGRGKKKGFFGIGSGEEYPEYADGGDTTGWTGADNDGFPYLGDDDALSAFNRQRGGGFAWGRKPSMPGRGHGRPSMPSVPGRGRHRGLRGLGADDDWKAGLVTSLSTSGTSAVTNAIKTGEISTTDQIIGAIGTAAKIGTDVYTAKLVSKYAPRTTAAQPSLMTRAATTVFAPDQPLWKRPLFWGGMALLIGAGSFLMLGGGGKKKGGTRRRSRRNALMPQYTAYSNRARGWKSRWA